MTKPRESWAVSVERNGENVVTIESNCLSGRDLSADDKRVIEVAARHLLSFLGVGSELIAAAPDLLVACAALDEFQRMYASNTLDSAPGNEHYSRLLLSVVAQARAAIAKVEGR
jgi:hypothetical protein